LLTLTSIGSMCLAADPDQSSVAPPAGDGWQALSATPVATPSTRSDLKGAQPSEALASASTQTASAGPSMAVTPVVLASTGAGTSSGTSRSGILTLAITPQDINLRNGLDRWLQQQGWQLAWKIDDDLPLEFNATFTGDFKSVLTQVMQATNHMRTPTRVCKHSNNVIRVVARAANCQD
jgi:hypothetical protein